MNIVDASSCDDDERKAISGWWLDDDRRLFGIDVVEAGLADGSYEQPFEFVLRDDSGRVVGKINGNCSLGLARIDGLIVDANERGHGYGSELVRAAERFCLEHGAKSIVLLTDANGTAEFYARHGFEIEHEHPSWTSGLTFVQMRKTLHE